MKRLNYDYISGLVIVSCMIFSIFAVTRPRNTTNFSVPIYENSDYTYNKRVNNILAVNLSSAHKVLLSESGVAMVIDANDGAIKGASCLDGSGLTNNIGCMTRPYEPGSVIKPLIFATAINEHRVNPETEFNTDGLKVIDGRYIRNYETYETNKFLVKDTILRSINTGAIDLLEDLSTNHKVDPESRELWYSYLTKHFQFGKKVSIDIPNEDSGAVIRPNNADMINYRYATSAFGINIATTPLQLSSAYSALVNGGVFYKPYYKSSSKKTIETNNIISNSTSEQVQEALSEAYEYNNIGEGHPGYTIGGKTGTAPIVENELYTTKDVGTYIGFVKNNASNKTYVILVSLKNPQSSELASREASRVWARITDSLINEKII